MRINQVAHSIADAEELPRLIQLSENFFAASFFLNETAADYESLSTTRAIQYNTTTEVVERATKRFWPSDTDSQTESVLS